TELAERVDEGAPAEAVLAEPRVEEVEHGEQALAGRHRTGRGGRDALVPLPGPVPQHRDDEVVLGGEQRVDALEGDARLVADGVHPDGLHPLGVEQPVGRSHHGRACARVVEHACHLLSLSPPLRGEPSFSSVATTERTTVLSAATKGARPWGTSPSGRRTPPTSSSTTRTRAPVSRSSSSTATRSTGTAGSSRSASSSTRGTASSRTTVAGSARRARSAPGTTTTPSPPTSTRSSRPSTCAT